MKQTFSYDTRLGCLFWTQGQKLVAAICERHGCELAELLSQARHRSLVDLRAHCAWVLRNKGFSLLDIGRCLHRDHTSIIYLLRRPVRLPIKEEAE